MNEVFEKIKNELHKEDLEFMQQSDLMVCIDSIIDKVAVDYSNGWIPCSERLPKVEDLHEKSLDNCTCYIIQRRCGIMDVAHYIKVYGEPYFEANSIKMKDVVAWMPLPEQYNPKFVQKCVNPSSKEEIEELNKKIRSIPVCTYPTNADRIRSMSDEELVEWLTSITDDAQSDAKSKCDYQWSKWLQSEVEE